MIFTTSVVVARLLEGDVTATDKVPLVNSICPTTSVLVGVVENGSTTDVFLAVISSSTTTDLIRTVVERRPTTVSNTSHKFPGTASLNALIENNVTAASLVRVTLGCVATYALLRVHSKSREAVVGGGQIIDSPGYDSDPTTNCECKQ